MDKQTLGLLKQVIENDGSGGSISDEVLQTKVEKILTNDGITPESVSEWNASEKKAHEHSNKSVLDAITSTIVDGWNTAKSWVSTNGANVLNHLSNTTVHITSAERTKWDGKSDFSGSYDDLTNKPTIPTVPTALPNPNKLTFTGAVTAEYDGSEAVSVDIPEGGSGGGSTVSVDQILTEGTEIGGVTVDGTRTPFFAPSGAEWETVLNVELTESTTLISQSITSDICSRLDSCTDFMLFLFLPASSETWTSATLKFGIYRQTWYNYRISAWSANIINTTANKKQKYYLMVSKNPIVGVGVSSSCGYMEGITAKCTTGVYYVTDNFATIDYLRAEYSGGFPAGTTMGICLRG